MQRCPFCSNNINATAVVCGHCNAYKSTPVEEDPMVGCLIVLPCLFLGPVILLLAIFSDAFPVEGWLETIGVIIFGLVATWLGWKFITIFEIGEEKWYRRRH
jgi:hypothetical protein